MPTLDGFRSGTEDEPRAAGVAAVITAIVRDPVTRARLNGAVLTSLTLTLLSRETGEVVNGRAEQDVLNANGGSVDGDGNVEVVLSPDDMALLDPESMREGRVAAFRYTWVDGPPGGGYHEHWYDVLRPFA